MFYYYTYVLCKVTQKSRLTSYLIRTEEMQLAIFDFETVLILSFVDSARRRIYVLEYGARIVRSSGLAR